MTTVRLAWTPATTGSDALLALARTPAGAADPPAGLVSYAYWKSFAKVRGEHPELPFFRNYSLDSGAFTAANSGKPIDFGAYIEFTKELQKTDPLCAELFSLDVIGDWRASQKNAETMWKAGIQCIPTFHVGEPTSAVVEMASAFPKISIGGAVRWSIGQKIEWAEQVFARVWPKKIHGLGMTSEQMLMKLPFHSCDSSDWFVGPGQWGCWKTMGKLAGVRAAAVDVRVEIAWYMRLERTLRQRWGKTLAALEVPA